MERAGLVFIIPSDYPLLERQAELGDVIAATEGFNLAALRLATAGQNRETMIKRGDALREIGHKHDISVLVEDHATLAQEIGLDGVHLNLPSANELRAAKKTLSKDAIIGVSAGASRHEGLVLGEIGVDYVSFGPLADRGLDEPVADAEIFEWWSEMIEVPLIAEGALDAAHLAKIKDYVDFVALGVEIFNADAPLTALAQRLSIL